MTASTTVVSRLPGRPSTPATARSCRAHRPAALVVLAADPVGPDRLADAAGGVRAVGGPCIVADLGTATTVDVVGAVGRVGGWRDRAGIGDRDSGAGGPGRSAAAGRTGRAEARDRPDTDAAIRSGAVFGHAALVDGLVARFREELGAELPAVATGGLSAVVAPHCRTISQVDPWLTLRGLAILGG